MTRAPSLAARLAPGRRGPAAAAGCVAATLAFFATLALALALASGRLADEWSAELAGAATLQVDAAGEAVETQTRAALEVLRTTPGVLSVRIIEVDEQRALLAPWFGAEAALDALPLPLLIEVQADRETLDRDALTARLAAEAPGAVYDDHAAWRAPLVASAHRLRAFGLAAFAALALVLGATTAVAATAAVAGAGPAIRTLRLVGARDALIGSAYTRRVSFHAAVGALVGAALGAALAALLPAGDEAGFFLIGIRFVGWQWLAPLLAAAVFAGTGWVAARIAARRALRKWS